MKGLISSLQVAACVLVVLAGATCTIAATPTPTPSPTSTPTPVNPWSGPISDGGGARPYVTKIDIDRTPIPIPRGCQEPSGVAFGDGFLWVTDLSDSQLWRIDPSEVNPEPAASIDLPALENPGPTVFDDENGLLWIIADVARPTPTPIGTPPSPNPFPSRTKRRIVKIPVADPHAMSTVPIPRRATGQTLTDITWDGEKLWFSVGGGLCACVYKVDQDNAGQIQYRFFPRGEPVGLAVDRDGKRLWMAADQGEDREPWLLERFLVGTTGGPSGSVPLYRTQRFLILANLGGVPVRPRGIVADGRHLWVLDWKETDFRGPGRSRLLRYKVRR